MALIQEHDDKTLQPAQGHHNNVLHKREKIIVKLKEKNSISK